MGSEKMFVREKKQVLASAHRTRGSNLRFHLGLISLRKSKIGLLNPKESENGFCASLLNRSIQDLLDHGASKEPKNPLPPSLSITYKELSSEIGL